MTVRSRPRILSWNVRADAQLLQPGARTKSVVDSLVNRCQWFAPDIIALQEADRPLVDALGKHSQYHGWHLTFQPSLPGRTDGCLVMVRQPYEILVDTTFAFTTDGKPTGRTAQVLEIKPPVGPPFVFVNVHFRWAPPGTPANEHEGRQQALQLVEYLAGCKQVLVATDSNDRSDGPVRQVLLDAGYILAAPEGGTAVVNKDEVVALDLVALRGFRPIIWPSSVTAVPPLPSAVWPSDHISVLVEAYN